MKIKVWVAVGDEVTPPMAAETKEEAIDRVKQYLIDTRHDPDDPVAIDWSFDIIDVSLCEEVK